MSSSKQKKEILDKTESIKEVLSTMPRNNAKNIEKYVVKLEELKQEYTEYEQEILKELNKRYENATNIPINNEITVLEGRLSTIDGASYVLKDQETSYEKMELDKYIYRLSKFYKENLENVNNQIALCIKAFSKVGIIVDASQFDYSIHANEYMQTFFKELEKGNINSDILKEKFEDIYWRCPDIIMHIELNLRYLYLSNESLIDKYFVKEANELLKKWQKAPNEIRNCYLDLKRQKLEKMAIDKSLLLDKFVSGKLKTKNYTDEKIKSNLSKVIEKDAFQDFEEKKEEILTNVFKFLNSLYEYKNYMNFNFIIEDIKKYYKEKENYKKVYIDTKKQIDEKEKKLRKLNKKLSSNGFFGMKKDITKQTAEQTTLIAEIKELYKQLDLNKFYNKIYSELKDDSTIYEALNLASSYYTYLTDVMIKNNKTITQEEIDEQIAELDEFLTIPYNTIINNMTILEEKDIAIIIKDRYKLLNFIVEKEDLTMNNVDTLVGILEDIIIGDNMKKAGLNIENIEEICELKKILKKK